MRVLGIDPGIAITGFAVLEGTPHACHPLVYGCIRTHARMAHLQRLKIIYEDLNNILTTYQPEVAAVEKLFFNQNVTTALKVGEARGVVLLSLAQANLNVLEYTPLQIKQAVVGYGKADKQQVQFMIKADLNLDQVPKPDDVADACAVALTHLRSFRLNRYYKE